MLLQSLHWDTDPKNHYLNIESHIYVISPLQLLGI